MQDQPDQATMSMGNHPDGLLMSQARDIAVIDNLEDTSFGLYGGIGGLIENAPHMAVALRRPVAVVHSRTLLVAGACAHPRGEVFLGRKCRCRGAYFGDDLLRRIDSQTGHLRQPLHRVLMVVEQSRHLLVELTNLLFDQLQLFQRHLQEPAVNGVQLHARAERIT